MVFLKATILTMFLVSTIVKAQGQEVRAREFVCDGPRIANGDLSRLKTAIEAALAKLKEECIRKNPNRFAMLKGREKIIRFETTYAKLHCLDIEMVDQCFVR